MMRKGQRGFQRHQYYSRKTSNALSQNEKWEKIHAQSYDGTN